MFMNIILSSYYWWVHAFETGVTKSPYVWQDGNSDRAVDNVQTAAKPLCNQHEDL